MVYLDSSTLLKLLWRERESEAARDRVAREDVVIVSSLAELEVEVQLKTAWAAGKYPQGHWRRFRAKLAEFRDTDPFRFQPLAASVFHTALRQHHAAGRSRCRTLDRLHLAAMEELHVRQLLTHDVSQAAAARAIGFEVSMPGVA